ncbi:hypothetical protein VB713_00925 [Anabaena cylindrica UHCC 0172]|uniref:hypothetical protein n=1 Tax=Anabaena cylindrica TaxID=1165 RepID=UPI002B210DDF|nr:hypothetical protein [Anabaena cylindrica]MEA5549554.1 hypothetical protein [Anabaena cylindrica UHCC 0172]
MQIDLNLSLGTFLFLIICGMGAYSIKRQNSTCSEQSSTKLIFTVMPKISQVIGLIFIGIATIFFIVICLYPPIIQLNCNRSIPDKYFINMEDNIPQPVCELVELNWFGHENFKKLVTNLHGVELESKIETDKEGKVSYKYQVMLLTNTDNIPFRTHNYSKYESKKYQFVISTIESFLSNSLQTSLVFQEDDRNVGYAGMKISLFLGMLSLLIITSGSSIICFFDKEANFMTLTRSRWLGIFGKEVTQHKLDELVDVKVERTDGEEGFIYRVVFAFNSGKILPLTHVYSSGSASKYQRSKIIKDFLNLKS